MAVKCPVCGEVSEEKAKVCAMCGFADLDRVFLSQEDYQEWLEHMVKPVATGYNEDHQCEVGSWKDIASIACRDDYMAGLRKDGTVIAFGNKNYLRDVESWEDIVSIACSSLYIVGLRKDGTVVTSGNSFKVSSWKDIVSITCGDRSVFGLRKDGTVVASGFANPEGQCEVGDWKDIVSITACHFDYTVGLRKDGTVVARRLSRQAENGKISCPYLVGIFIR